MSRRVSAAQLELSSKPHALYRFYDRTDVLLYVGITMDLPTRFKNHRNKKPWWTQVHQIGVEQFATRQEALAAEAEAIRAEKPLYNDQHNELVNLEDPLPKLSEIDGQWLLENWPKIPPTIRDYIEVPAWRDGWYGLADTLLESFTPMEIKRYVELGKAQGERDGEDDLDGPESKVRAIEAAVKDLQLTVALLSLSIDNLMDFLPLEQVNRVLGQAHDDLDTAETARTGLSDGLVLAHAMNHLVHEAASAHLNGLDEPAREACLRRAKEAYPDIDERQLVLVAAQHSRHQQAFGAPLLDEIKELGA